MRTVVAQIICRSKFEFLGEMEWISWNLGRRNIGEVMLKHLGSDYPKKSQVKPFFVDAVQVWLTQQKVPALHIWGRGRLDK